MSKLSKLLSLVLALLFFGTIFIPSAFANRPSDILHGSNKVNGNCLDCCYRDTNCSITENTAVPLSKHNIDYFNISFDDKYACLVQRYFDALNSKDYYAIVKIFPGFHVHDSTVHSHACHGGGVLSQMGSNSLSNSGYSWQNILHYYYDYDGSFNRTSRNEEMAQGDIVVLNINHTIIGQGAFLLHSNIHHKRKCLTCGCYHLLLHNFVFNASLDKYVCTDCGYSTSNIDLPARIGRDYCIMSTPERRECYA